MGDLSSLDWISALQRGTRDLDSPFFATMALTYEDIVLAPYAM